MSTQSYHPMIGHSITDALLELHNEAASYLTARKYILWHPSETEQQHDKITLHYLSRKYAEVCSKIHSIHTQNSFQL